MEKTYRVGVVGCGGMGRSHTGAWTDHPVAEVVAVADINETQSQKLVEQFSIPEVFTDYNEMFAKMDLDIVSIPTWQGFALKSPLRRLMQASRASSAKNRWLRLWAAPTT